MKEKESFIRYDWQDAVCYICCEEEGGSDIIRKKTERTEENVFERGSDGERKG